MTAHSERGQGGQPLYEGVVLPANGDPWTPEQQRQVDRAEPRPASVPPPAGQAWGEPWGPRSEAAAAQGDAAGTLPPPPASGPSMPPAPSAPAAPAAPPVPGALPESDGQPLPGTPPHQPVSAPASPAAEIASGPSAPPMPSSPPATPAPGFDGQPLSGGSADVPAGGGRHRGGPATAESGPGMPQPAQQPPSQHQQSQPQQAAPAPQSGPVAPPVSPTDATAYIPPVTDGPPPAGGYPQSGPDADPTQMLPPQNGHSPVSAPAPSGNPEETTQLRTPLPPETGAAAPGAASSQPPAGFESLFRAEPGASAGSPGTTQSLPFFDNAAGRQRNNDGVGGLGKPGGPAAPYGQPQPASSGGAHRPQGRAARREAERSTLSRISPPVLIGVGVAVVAGLGMALGAALTSGDEKEKKADKPQTKSSAEPAAERSASADPAEPQAKELDKLLAASNDSRAQVVRAVESIKVCKRLRQSAADLKDAAGQRNSLVTRLGQLKTDKISGSSQLNSALTRAWKASASADNHYAAWAGEAASKKGRVCHKGKARPTRHTALAARVSGDATTAKKQAASLWNPTAKKYGLKERAFGDL